MLVFGTSGNVPRKSCDASDKESLLSKLFLGWATDDGTDASATFEADSRWDVIVVSSEGEGSEGEVVSSEGEVVSSEGEVVSSEGEGAHLEPVTAGTMGLVVSLLFPPVPLTTLCRP